VHAHQHVLTVTDVAVNEHHMLSFVVKALVADGGKFTLRHRDTSGRFLTVLRWADRSGCPIRG
jgi:hypothetical protein